MGRGRRRTHSNAKTPLSSFWDLEMAIRSCQMQSVKVCEMGLLLMVRAK